MFSETNDDSLMSGAGDQPRVEDRPESETEGERSARDDEVRKKIAALQQKLDGNRVPPGAATPQRRGQDKDTRVRARSSTGQADEEYRDGRRLGQARQRNDRGSQTRSLSPTARTAPMSPWSCLGEEGRPSNKTRQQINAMGVDAALRMKGMTERQ